MKDVKNFWLGAGVGLAAFAALATVIGALTFALEALKPIIGMGAALAALYALVLAIGFGFVGVAVGRSTCKPASDTAAQLHVEGR
ncbi:MULTISPECIES: hypothetical protein [unclassified Chelatococcus]|uniref:hypothetical protein n=1 Tax=unclassified Chelatococcus TaxID=2638111 RepID=UPI001BCAEA3C|nr:MULTISPECIES: hypothetical protein [unclassified Chelatococcus]CAH1665696.1 hypothetical protein CHELA41_22707 [Hyphomicrobiales bacterium]MBS7737757.1 hypothetical protein [Chelatococcus sp. HY11]MBX3547245.1 hypothetical protein [Chelatococcus sp.]MCO5077115.1 hypothetical protein [Chelatococcus sp.]CAH1681168.1 hypothetical protein CHELA20_52213 [Hyphomicrobiales bacterium]